MSTDESRLAYPVARVTPDAFPPDYATLRREAPTCPVTFVTGDPAWLVTRYEDVRTVLADRRFSRGAMCAEPSARYQVVRPSPDSILGMDPPRHTRLRRLVNHAFTTGRVEAMRPRIAQVTDELLDAMAEAGPPVDLVEAFARAMPLRIICEMLGLPLEDEATFIRWTATVMDLKVSVEDITAAYLEMRSYFAELLAHKRAHPSDDVLSMLPTLADEAGHLTDAEAISLGTFLLVAGHDTSVTVLADATLTLMRHPEQLAELLRDPALWPNAVEELLRLTNPGGSIFPRVATADVELSGVVVPKGSTVVAHIGSGCRDEAVVEDGDAFDIHRKLDFQIFFGHGPHFCLGAPLGRAEMDIGLRKLFERFPTLELAVAPEELTWRDYAALGGFETFPVTW